MLSYKQSCRKWSSLLALFFELAVTGFPTVWGNLSVYSVSYIRDRLQTDSPIMASWVLPTWMAAYCIIGFPAGQLALLIGKRPALLCGMLVQNIGLCLGYFFIDSPLAVFTVFVGFVNGLGSGWITVVVLQIVVDSVGSQAGLFIGLIRSGVVGGGIVSNFCVTAYLNPINETPDIDIGSLRFFSQKDVIERVPKLYLILGGSYFAIQFVSLFVIKVEPTWDKEEIDSSSLYASMDKTERGSDDENKPQPDSTNSQPGDGTVSENGVAVEKQQKDMSPREIISTVEFYALFSTLGMCNVSFVIANNYFKSYGQLWIHDDIFLTFAWDAYLATMVVLMPVWGYILDKYTVRDCLLVYYLFLPLVLLSVYFAPMINKWAYCASVLMFAFTGGTMLVVYAACVAKTFGRTYFASNYGLVTTGCVISNLVIPKLLEVIMEHAGWFYIFFLTAMLGFISLLIVMFGIKK